MNKFLILGIALVFLSCEQSKKPKQSVSTNDAPDGRQLFSINCASCHAVHKDLTGPALYGVTQRWSDKDLLYRYIKNSQEVIAENEYAKALFIKYNKTPMNPFPQLTDEQITAILDYVESQPVP